MRHGVTRKRSTKRLKHTGNSFGKNLQLISKVSVNSRLKAISIIGQRKTFCRQRIVESSCMKKETVDSMYSHPCNIKNGDRKIMKSI